MTNTPTMTLEQMKARADELELASLRRKIAEYEVATHTPVARAKPKPSAKSHKPAVKKARARKAPVAKAADANRATRMSGVEKAEFSDAVIKCLERNITNAPDIAEELNALGFKLLAGLDKTQRIARVRVFLTRAAKDATSGIVKAIRGHFKLAPVAATA